MRLLIILLALALVGCATGDATVKVGDEAVVTVTGNAPGRTITYTATDKAGTTTTITVEDERTPNPLKGLFDVVGSFFKAMWSKADVAIPIGGD